MILTESNLLNEEIEKYFPLPKDKIKTIFKIHKEISTKFTTKIPSIVGYSQDGKYFSEYTLCYVLNIKINIEYVSDTSIKNLMFLPINFCYTSFIPLKDKYKSIKVNPKINDTIIEILDDSVLYIYINFSPY